MGFFRWLSRARPSKGAGDLVASARLFVWREVSMTGVSSTVRTLEELRVLVDVRLGFFGLC